MSRAADVVTVETRAAKESCDITETVREVVRRSGVASGLCHVMVLHSTAAIVVNETDDPNIGTDVLTALDRAVPALQKLHVLRPEDRDIHIQLADALQIAGRLADAREELSAIIEGFGVFAFVFALVVSAGIKGGA